MPTEKDLTSLIVNKVDTLATYRAMKNAGNVKSDELYSIEELNDLNLEEFGANIPIQEVAPTEEYVELWIDTSENEDVITPESLGVYTKEETNVEIAEAISEIPILCVTPQMYGAKGDGTTDDTDAINAAIDAAAGGCGVVYFPDGNYLVSSSMSSSLGEGDRYTAIKVHQRENLQLILSPNAHLKHRVLTEDELLAGNTCRYYIIGIINSSNIQVTGGIIEGESDEHIALYKDNENVFWWQDDGTYSRGHGYGICVRGSSNVRIDGCEVFNCFGDSLHVSQNDAGDKSDRVVIENCDLHDSTRQGISVTGAINTTIRNCEIYNIVGNAPQSGIDFEPNFVEGMNINSIVENCFIHDCTGYALINAKANKDAKIRNCRLYGKITSTGDDTYPVEFTNCDILHYQSSNAHRNKLYNCRIATCGMYEAGDDFYDCIFNPDLFNHVIDGYGLIVSSLIAAGPAILPTSIGRFYRCKFHTENSGGYISNFRGWRNNGIIGDVVFENCEFLIGSHEYQTFNIKALNNVDVTNCLFTTVENTYAQQFMEITAPNDMRLVGNVFDVKTLTSYTSTNNAILSLHGKNVCVDGNQFNASTKICAYPISQDFVSEAGEVYILRNSMKAWNQIGNFQTESGKFVTVDNIVSTSASQAEFTEEYRDKLDNVSSLISDAGFITEEESKGYTDSKIAELNADGIQQTPLFANNIEECTDTSKVYVLPDGYVYGYMLTQTEVESGPAYTNLLPSSVDVDGVTIYGDDYNGDGVNDGYKTATRLSSSTSSIGSTASATNADMCTSGFIPAAVGDVFRLKGATAVTGIASYVMSFDASKTRIAHKGMGQNSDLSWKSNEWAEVDQADDNLLTFTLSSDNFGSGIAFIRINGHFDEGTIITRNEEIKEGGTEIVEEWVWTSTGHAFVPADYEDRIIELEETTEGLKSGGSYSGAKWFALGDSITEGWTSAVDASATSGYRQYLNTNTAERWVNIVAKKNGYELTNYGVGGTGYAHAKTDTVNARAQVANIDFSQCDFVTLAYGVNDWKGKATLGSMDDDVDTVDAFVPNMRYVIEKILADNPYCKIFVITPLNCRSLGTYDTNWGIGYANPDNASGPGLENIFQLEKTVCDYYGIELIDMTHNSIVNRENIKTALADYVHPTVECHAAMARELVKKITFM